MSSHKSGIAIGLALAGIVLGLALSIWMAVGSDGVHHDDDLVHLQMARWSWEYPQYLLHEWGRPGFTVLYALPARFGWPAARIFTGVLTALTGWLAYCTARRQGINLAAIVPVLLWLQPMTFTLSYTTLTEPVLAFYFVLACWLYVRGNHACSAAVISLCTVTRHEAALFALLWVVACWYRRRPVREWLWVFWAPLLHNLLAVVFLDKIPLLAFLDPTPTTEYGSGQWLTMLASWTLMTAGAGPLTLALVGAPTAWRRIGGRLLLGCGLAYFLAHTVFFRFGLFASGGYYRFLVPLGPVVAIAAAAALSEAWGFIRATRVELLPRSAADRLRRMLLHIAGAAMLLWIAVEVAAQEWLWWAVIWMRWGLLWLLTGCVVCFALCAARRALLRRIAAAACPLALLWVTVQQPVLWAPGIQPPFQQCAPLRLAEPQLQIRAALMWLEANDLGQRRVVAANPWVDEFLGRSQSPFRPPTRKALELMQPGELFVWDLCYCPSPAHDIQLAEMRERADFVELWHGRPHLRDGVYCRVFAKRVTPTSTPASGQDK